MECMNNKGMVPVCRRRCRINHDYSRSHSLKFYAHSLAECEEKLAAMIREVQAEMAAAKAALKA